jgi:hypothetical protein
MIRRREFLGATALTTVALGLGAVAGCQTPMNARLGAGSAADDLFGLEGAQTLIRAARHLYPHDAISDDVYDRVVEQALRGGGPPLFAQYEEGLAALDGARGRPFLDLSRRQQVAVLAENEATPFFASFRGGVQASLYEQPEVWEAIGYPGPALPFGGYWDKGFDDIDWLPAEDA